MKKSIAVTTALCAAACAALFFGGVTAYAETAEEPAGLDRYPQTFTKTFSFDALEDYAADKDGNFVFLQRNVVYEYDGETLTEHENPNVLITALYFSDTFYCGGDGKFYNLDFEEQAEFTDNTVRDKFDLDGFYYSFNSENVLVAYNTSTMEHTELAGFENLKKFGNTAYAVKDNVLYTISGNAATAVVVEHFDYSSTKSIKVGDIKESLLKSSLISPRFVRIASGAHMTQIDADMLDGDFFQAGDTVEAGKDITATTAVLLGTAGADGSISLIMTGGNCYITSSSSVTLISRSGILSEPTFKNATVSVSDGFIYSAPFVCANTHVTGIKSGDKLEVLNAVLIKNNGELQLDFYRVSYKDESGEAFTGYVPVGYVSPYSYNENPPGTITDPNATTDDVIKPVVLVLVVVVLVLIALGYIIYVGAAGKRKIKKPEDENKDKK